MAARGAPSPGQPRRGAHASSSSPYRRYGLLAGGLALVVVLILAVTIDVYWLLAWIGGWSIITFLFYGLDKHWATTGHERVPEVVLHGLSLVGGFPGGWAGRAVFHHKTRHAAFLLVLIGSTILWAGVAAWLLLRARG